MQMKSASRVVYKGRNFGTASCKVERGYKPDLETAATERTAGN